MDNYKHTLLAALRKSWAEVRELHAEEARAVLTECALACVREDFQAKFLRELNSRRAITSRFFHRAVEFEVTARLETILRSKSTSAAARVVWGSLVHPIGFEVRGLAKSADALFVDEGDAVGHLFAGRRSVWLFLGGASGVLWRLRGGHEQAS